MPRLPHPPLLVISDRQQAPGGMDGLPAALSGAVAGGARWISLREKDLPAEERLGLLRRLADLGALTGAQVSVHDDIDAAALLGLGLHLPAEGDPAAARARLGGGALIGISAHDLAGVQRAGRRGADYVTLSPIFPTSSKPGYGPALGLDGLRAAASQAACPILALGGIGPATIDACLDAGAAGVAVMGEIMRAADPMAAARDLIRAGWHR